MPKKDQLLAQCLTGAAMLGMLAVSEEPAFSQSQGCVATQQLFQSSASAGSSTDAAQPFNFAVPAGVTSITIDAAGAQGGNSTSNGAGVGGKGAEVVATVSVTPGQMLCIVAGVTGGSGTLSGSGGGGSFVFTGSGSCAFSQASTSLLVASGGGGGGGLSAPNVGGPGRATGLGVGAAGALSGGAGNNSGAGAGGTSGNGGSAGTGGGGGGGLQTDGGSSSVPCNGGKALTNGAAGAGSCVSGTIRPGGFGGGGTAGGGGGYNGGGGAADNPAGAGGGGSFSAQAPSFAQDGVQAGNGGVSLCYTNIATHFSVSAPSSATAGTAFNVTVTALDASNNTATGYAGTVHFTSSDGAAVLPANSTLTNGTGTFSVTLKTAGSQTVTATDTVTSSITGTSNSTTVSAGSATHYSVSAPSSATAGTAFNITVTVLDASNNTATGYAGTAHFTSSDGAAVLPANSTLTNGTGTFSVTLKTAGSQTVTATDTVSSSITGASNSITVGAGTVTHYSVSAPSSTTAGTPFNITVSALDVSNNTVTGYVGAVGFTSSDGSATLPANSTLTNGTGTFLVTLRTSGGQTITATDTATSSITGTSGNINVTVATGSIRLLGACSPANWSNPACWDVNRRPASGDDVVVSGSALPATIYDLGPGVLLHSLTISSAAGAITVGGGPIGLQSGATVTDGFNNGGVDALPGFTLSGPVTFSVTSSGETLKISGAITGAFGTTKIGGGTLQFASTNTYSGSTTVSAGTLNVTGSLSSSPVTVGAGGTLTGTGAVLSILTQSGGTVSGNLTSTGGTIFGPGATLVVTLTNDTTFSKLLGPVTLTGGPTLTVVLAPGYSPTFGKTFTVIPGAVTGTFGGVPNGSSIPAGGTFFRVNYASVTLTALSPTGIPVVSPRALFLLALLLAAVGLWMSRRPASTTS